jgi:prolyl 4-hydroxylase
MKPLVHILLLLLISLHHLTLGAEVIIGADGAVDEADCQDTSDSCVAWAKSGECNSNPGYMHLNCKRSCNICTCVDLDVERCPHWAYHNNCAGDQETFMYIKCIKSCKACGYSGEALDKLKEERGKLAAVGGDARLLETKYGYKQIVSPGLEEATAAIIKETEDYMEQEVYANTGADSKYKNVQKTCMIRHDSCAYWKTQGVCETNRKYMRQNCAPVCQVCEELDFKFWCPIDETTPMAFPNPGDLNAMFERIASEKDFEQYSPKVISMPKSDDAAADPASTSTPSTIQDGPWFIEFENFLTEEECKHLIELGAQIGYKTSVDTGVQKVDGSFDQIKSTWRTSATAWCSGNCLMDDIFQKVAKRVEAVTGIPQQNAENLQLLKYDVDEFYKYHHDCTPHHKERQMGPRVLTMFLYLNTVEAGGGTNFPDMNITITPKLGKAVLWPNVLNEEPLVMDRRTAHQALPLEKGLKYGANLWIHQRDWREVAARGCI